MHPDDQSLATLAPALSHPARVRILRQLARDGRCDCGQIVATLPLAQSTISQHLKVMRVTGLVASAPDGNRVLYWIDPFVVRQLRTLIAAL